MNMPTGINLRKTEQHQTEETKFKKKIRNADKSRQLVQNMFLSLSVLTAIFKVNLG